MKFEYASVRILSNSDDYQKDTKIYIKTPNNDYAGSIEEIFKKLKLEKDPSLVGIFNYLGDLGWKLHNVSKENMYFFERIRES